MESTPMREDVLPSYLENTKSTAYRWPQDTTESTAHPSVGDTTHDQDISKENDRNLASRVKELATLIDDLDASAKSSRIRATELFQSYSRSQSTSPPDSPTHESIAPSQAADPTSRRDLSNIHEDSEDDEELLSDIDEMINNVPSDEEPDPQILPRYSTPITKSTGRHKSKTLAREVFDPIPARDLKGGQKTPAAKTPAKQVDFKDFDKPRHPANLNRMPGYVAPSPVERRPPSPRKVTTQATVIEPPPRQPSPVSPNSVDPTLKLLQSQIAQMREDIRKRDVVIQDLLKEVSIPRPDVSKEIEATKRELEILKEEQSELKRSQQDILAMNTPERILPTTPGTKGVRERPGKWQEYLETPISISQRRSRRDTRQSRVLDDEDVLPPQPTTKPVPINPVQPDRQSDDEVVRLREALAKAEAQIAQLRTEKAAGRGPGEGHEMHARALGPSMMPDAKSAKLAREEKMYYRLGLYKIDRLCSNETANLLKNVLIQLDVPLDQLIYEITHVSHKMLEYKRLQEFAFAVHEKLYAGKKMELSEGEGCDVECLREMLVKVGKLVPRRK